VEVEVTGPVAEDERPAITLALAIGSSVSESVVEALIRPVRRRRL
jgi:hypothetical protein